MKAITICQPYAHMIAVTREKRVENRTWPTNYRGDLYIHAGMNRKYWDEATDRARFPKVAWGAVVGMGKLIDVVKSVDILAGKYDQAYPWLRGHEHVHGPWCWVLAEVVAIGPWPYRGAQGLFDIDQDELGRIANQVLNGRPR